MRRNGRNDEGILPTEEGAGAVLIILGACLMLAIGTLVFVEVSV